MITCPSCDGSGEGMHPGTICPECKGLGEVPDDYDPDDRPGPEWEAD